MFVFEELLTYAFMFSLLLISAPVAVFTILWLSKNFDISERDAKEFGGGQQLRGLKKKIEVIKEDEDGNYDIDGVSYDGDDICVAGDGKLPAPKNREYRWASNF